MGLSTKLGAGRDESYWTPLLDDLPWLGDRQTIGDMLLLAPHPDDEVLACGGLLQRWYRRAGRAEIWMVTDGEACFGDAADTAQVGARRRDEASEAHHRLGIEVNVRWLSLPDSHVKDHLDQLRGLLDGRIGPDTVLIAPLPLDGHPDHDGTGAVAYELALRHKLLLVQYPIWLWHWADCTYLQSGTAARLQLSAAEEIRKRDAIAAFDSQIHPEHGTVVLPRAVLRHFRRSFEVLFVEDFRVSTHSSTVL